MDYQVFKANSISFHIDKQHEKRKAKIKHSISQVFITYLLLNIISLHKIAALNFLHANRKYAIVEAIYYIIYMYVPTLCLFKSAFFLSIPHFIDEKLCLQ